MVEARHDEARLSVYNDMQLTLRLQWHGMHDSDYISSTKGSSSMWCDTDGIIESLFLMKGVM